MFTLIYVCSVLQLAELEYIYIWGLKKQTSLYMSEFLNYWRVFIKQVSVFLNFGYFPSIHRSVFETLGFPHDQTIILHPNDLIRRSRSFGVAILYKSICNSTEPKVKGCFVYDCCCCFQGSNLICPCFQ